MSAVIESAEQQDQTKRLVFAVHQAVGVGRGHQDLPHMSQPRPAVGRLPQTRLTGQRRQLLTSETAS